MSTSSNEIEDPLRSRDINEMSSEDEYHDVAESTSPLELDSVVLNADQQQAQEGICAEEKIVLDDSEDEGTSNNKIRKKKVQFKSEDTIEIQFPSGRLWEPGTYVSYTTLEK